MRIGDKMAKSKNEISVQAPVKYVTVARRAETEFEEKKSIFICNVAPVKTEEEAMEFINDDEMLEITPKNVRIRKKTLDTETRLKRKAKGLE